MAANEFLSRSVLTQPADLPNPVTAWGPVGPPGVASSVPYGITGIQKRNNCVPADFIGEVSFVIDLNGQPFCVEGTGVAKGTGVRFYQKDNQHDGRDVRVWRISAAGGSRCVAEHVPAM